LHTTIPASYAFYPSGNYYDGYTEKVYFPKSSLSYQFDTLKFKSFIVAYNAAGNYRWKKQLEGLQPQSMLANGQDLKVYGTNYIGSGYTNGYMYFSSNASPTTFDVMKLTMVTDSASYAGQGRKGLGSIDNLVATLSAADGAMSQMVTLGGPKEEEMGTMAKGYGDQVWSTSTVGVTMRNVINLTDTTSTLLTNKIPVSTICVTPYAAMSSFVNFDITGNKTVCADSTFTLHWSSNGLPGVDLWYSTNGGSTFQSLANNIIAGTGSYSFNAIQSGIVGNVVFKIQGGSFTDTVSQTIYPMPLRAYPTGKALFCPYDTGVYLQGAFGAGYKYKWNTGDTTRIKKVQNMYREPYYDNVLYVPQYQLTTTTTNGCVRTETIMIDSVPHYRSVPVINLNATGDSLVSNMCGVPHVWYKDNIEIPGLTACKLKITASGMYRAAARHATSGCTTWKSNSVNAIVTSVVTLPPDVESITIAPNPAHERTLEQIHLQNTATLQVHLLSRQGKKV